MLYSKIPTELRIRLPELFFLTMHFEYLGLGIFLKLREPHFQISNLDQCQILKNKFSIVQGASCRFVYNGLRLS